MRVTTEPKQLAVVIIGHPMRRQTTLLDSVQSILDQNPDELLVVGDYPHTAPWPTVTVDPMTRTTIDALVKRDVGWLKTTAESVLFLVDDHRLDPEFMNVYRTHYAQRRDWDVLVPARYTVRDGRRIWLNVGQDMGYCGGHGGIFRRVCASLLPWSAGPHHPNWDVLHTHQLVQLGAKLVYANQDLAIEDIEPGASPWQ